MRRNSRNAVVPDEGPPPTAASIADSASSTYTTDGESDGSEDDQSSSSSGSSSDGESDGDQQGENSDVRSPSRLRKRSRRSITLDTLFELVPFYGDGDAGADAAFRAILLSLKPTDIDIRDASGNTLLVTACQYGKTDIVEQLLNRGADPSAINEAGACGLHYAAHMGMTQLARLLLQSGANASQQETAYGCMPLHYAASVGAEEICTALVAGGADPSAEDFYRYTAAGYASDAGYTALAKVLGGVESSAPHGPPKAGGGGIWVRKVDPTSGMGYHENSATGESWWEADALAAHERGQLPPQVQDWLRQQEMRSEIIGILVGEDPIRLTEVDQLIEGAGGTEGLEHILKELRSLYRISSLETDSGDEGEAVLVLDSSDLGLPASAVGTSSSARRTDTDLKMEEELKKLRGEREAVESQRAQDRKAREAKRAQTSLEVENLQAKATDAMSILRNLETQRDQLQTELADIAKGGIRARMEAEVEVLGRDLESQKALHSHLKEAMEGMKGSTGERRQREEAAEQVRLDHISKLAIEGKTEVERIHLEHSQRLNTARQAWAKELAGLQKGVAEEVSRTAAELKGTQQSEAEGIARLRKEAEENRAKMAEDEAAWTACKKWVSENQTALSEAQAASGTNATLNAALEREFERAKQLHNRLVDMKGQSRVIGVIRPLSEAERAEGASQSIFKEGNQTLIVALSDEQKVYDFDLILQAEGHAALFKEVHSLATSLVDGFSVCLLACGPQGGGKSYALTGFSDGSGHYFDESSQSTESGARAGEGGVPSGPIALASSGLIPRLAGLTFSVLESREAMCAYTLSVQSALIPTNADDAVRWDESPMKVVRTPQEFAQEAAAALLPHSGHRLVRAELRAVNHCTKDVITSHMVVGELDGYPSSISALVRAHAASDAVATPPSSNPVLASLGEALKDSAKSVTLVCPGPTSAGADAAKFGGDCRPSGGDTASALRDLKKQLAKLKKDQKQGRSHPEKAPVALPRPTTANRGGRG